MSVKIPFAYKIDKTTNLNVLLKLVEQIRDPVFSMAKEKMVSFLALNAMEKIDRACRVGSAENLPSSMLSTIAADMRNRQAKVRETQYRDPPVDVDYKLMFYPLRGKTLIMPM
ncbi:MAG TPA: hypothetical protein VIY47_11610, partial [Ignavibacteriaceae bacterium]